MLNPLISIIVPVYNVELYLRKCLDSILSQAYTNWEAILVDDGSTDRSGEICDEYAEKDNRFIGVHKQNEGVAKARITAFEHSKGELITFIDADDYVSVDYLKILSKPIIDDDADMVSCDYYKVQNGERRAPSGKLTGEFDKEGIEKFIAEHYFYDKQARGYGMTCFLWCKMVRREFVLNGLKNGLGMWFGEDQIAMFTMLLQCQKLVSIPDRLYYYIQHEGQAVKRYDESLWDNIIMLMGRYKSLIPNEKCIPGLRRRTWEYIERTVFGKMVCSGLDRKTFIAHLSRVRSHPFINEFFTPLYVDDTWRKNVKYWLLKLRLYDIYYNLFVKRLTQ